VIVFVVVELYYGILDWMDCNLDNSDMRFFIILDILLDIACSYWLFMMLPIFFFSNPDSHLLTVVTLPILLFYSSNIIYIDSNRAANLPVPNSLTVLVITSSVAVISNS
jgi:hypothetical protein